MKKLQLVACEFAVRLKREFADDIARDAKGFKKSVLGWLGRELPPRRGRPNDPHLDAAAEMVAQGKSVREVLRAQVRGFDRLDTYGRYLAEKGLRAAIARRHKRVTAPK